MKKTTNVATQFEPTDIRKYEEKSPLIWSIKNIHLPKNDKWDFKHRGWQRQIFDDTSQRLVVIKPTQIGLTTLMICKMLHFAAHNKVSVIYTLPRGQDVSDLVNGKFTPIANNSPAVANLIHGVDNVRQKHFGESLLHFMESNTQPRMTSADLLIHDEVDMSNQDNLEEYVGRLDASKYAMRWSISTPTLEDVGIHRMYTMSDQKYWEVTCSRCGLGQELDWDDNIRHHGNNTWLACKSCEQEIVPDQIQNGKWISRFPERLRNKDTAISGYSVSHLMVTSIPLSKLWEESKTMDIKRFYNIRLGKPYTPSTSAITRHLIYNNCINDTHEHENAGSGYFLGADQGNEIHAIVGRAEGDSIRIVHMEVIPLAEGFAGLHRLMKQYKIRRAVVDASPNRHSVLEFTEAYGKGKVLYAFYTNVVEAYKLHNTEPQVNINRGASFDALLAKIQTGKIHLYGTRNSVGNEVRRFIDHMVAMKRDVIKSVTNMGVHKAEVTWVNSGADHYAHAMNYLQIAVDSSVSAGAITIVNIGENRTENKPEPRNPHAQRRSLRTIMNQVRSSNSGRGEKRDAVKHS
jgi:hypothetical protein